MTTTSMNWSWPACAAALILSYRSFGLHRTGCEKACGVVWLPNATVRNEAMHQRGKHPIGHECAYKVPRLDLDRAYLKHFSVGECM